MKILIRPGLILAAGLLAIGAGVTIANWRLARDEARDRADYFEERVFGQTQRAKSLAERYTDLLAQYAVTTNELTTTRQTLALARAANEPLRREVEGMINAEIQRQAAADQKGEQLKLCRTQLARLRDRVTVLDQSLADITATNAVLTTANTQLLTEAETTRAALTTAITTRDAAFAQMGECADALTAARDRLVALEAAHATCETERRAARERADALADELEELRHPTAATTTQ